MPKLKLTLDYEIADVGRAMDALRDFCERLGSPAKPLHHFLLAIEEIVANAIHHGHPGPNARPIEIKASVDHDALRCEIVDAGIPFDPVARQSPPNVAGSIEDLCVGGLGIHITRTLMDAFTYERREGCNHTVLVKWLKRRD
jgi:anti-sigma regulatory factor (Ser/Thr protein kinase)